MQTKSFKRKIQLALLGISTLASIFFIFSCKAEEDSDSLTGVSITCANTSIGANGQLTLTADVTYSGSPTLTYEWSITSGSDYASLSGTAASSTVLSVANTTIKEQSVTVSVKVSDGSKSKTETKTITVGALDTIESVSITAETTQITATGNTTLTASPVLAESGTESNVTYAWTITDGSDYASLSGTTGSEVTLTGKNEDTNNSYTVTVSVTATYNGESVTNTCNVTVAPSGVVIPTGISLSSTAQTLEITETESAPTATLTATLTPSNVTSGYDTVTWTSSDTSVATVSDAGLVTAVSAGSATITAATKGNTYTATCAVTVKGIPTAITLSSSSLSLTIRDTDNLPTSTLTATLTPTNISTGYDTVTWSSSNTSVATVSDAGVVTAVSAGSATITATTKNNKTATCAVTVTENIATNFIKASDTPTGYASTSWSTSASTAVTVSTKSDLVKYAKAGKYIIYVNGMIDMSEGYLPSEAGGTSDSLDSLVNEKTNGSYTTYSAWKAAYAAACSTSTEDGSSSSTSKSSLYSTLWTLNDAYKAIIQLAIASNTTIIGLTDESGIKGGTLSISKVQNVVLRNLTIQDAYDPFPHHEENDGYNAQFDCITIQGSDTQNIWIDHCTFKDTMYLSYVSTGGSTTEKWQTYDGLLDIKGLGKYITVSYCKFMDHDKTSLIGSSDSEGSSSTRLITYHHNYFYNCGQRLPMVRNTTLHLYNNFYSASSPHYDQQYAVGVRAGSIIYAENNYFDSGIKYSFKDNLGKTGGTLNNNGNVDNSGGTSLSVSTSTTGVFSSAVKAYSYTADSASDVPSLVKANAGAGVWSVVQ